jgi:hypothetical protein
VKPVTLTIGFVYMHEPDPAFWALPVQVELRAEVTIHGRDLDQANKALPYAEPTVEPLDKAVWQDALGDEIAFGGVESPAWIGAKEAACEAAIELLSQQATRESGEMARAS